MWFFYILLSVDRHLGYFYILAIVDNAVMNMGVQISIHPEVRLVNHMTVLFSIF